MLSKSQTFQMGRDKATEGKNLTRQQFPWTWKGIKFYLTDQMQKTLQVELGVEQEQGAMALGNHCYIRDLGAKAEHNLHMD
jgi:hypothetical protein